MTVGAILEEFSSTEFREDVEDLQIMEKTISFTAFYTTDTTTLADQEVPAFGLPVDVAIWIALNLLHESSNNGESSSFWGNKVLVCRKFKEHLETIKLLFLRTLLRRIATHILFVVVVKFDTFALDILGSSASFLAELATIIEIGETFADQVHLFDPILIKIEILIQTQVGHSPSGGATSLAFLA